MATCRICSGEYEAFFSFGSMPLANGFILPEQRAHEYFFDLAVGVCQNCHMVQLIEQPSPEKMFHDHYAFYSSTSAYMANHFQAVAKMIQNKYLDQATLSNDLVVEIGSNDGIMLRHLAENGIPHLGIEPSANVAKSAQAKGVNTINRFFSTAVAQEIAHMKGQAQVIFAANVMCHISDLKSVAAGIHRLLDKKGVFIFEDPYWGDIVAKTSFDQIYDEHVYYFTLDSVAYLFDRVDMEVVDVHPQNVHGGSMRYVIAHKNQHPVNPDVAALKNKEMKGELHTPKMQSEFKIRVDQICSQLKKTLSDFKQQGKKVVGYGATSKSTTILNYSQITSKELQYISDTTPIKQGRLTPGTHIPVKPYAEFQSQYPDVALLLAWNHAQEIMAKEKLFSDQGGKWLLYVPEVQVI